MTLRELTAAEIGRDWQSIDVQAVMEAYEQAGAVHLEGFGFDQDSFFEFTSKLSPMFFGFPNFEERDTVEDDLTFQTVTRGDHGIAPHQEFSYQPIKPDLGCFVCLTPATEGGEMILCDGVRLAEETQEHPVLSKLCSKSIDRRTTASPDNWKMFISEFAGPDAATKDGLNGFLESFGIRENFDWDGDDLIVNYLQPVITRPLFSDKPALCNDIAWEYMFRDGFFGPGRDDWESADVITPVDLPFDVWSELKMATDRCSEVLLLKAGDALLIDNSRYLHGRRNFTGKREQFLRFGFYSPTRSRPLLGMLSEQR